MPQDESIDAMGHLNIKGTNVNQTLIWRFFFLIFSFMDECHDDMSYIFLSVNIIKRNLYSRPICRLY